MWVRFPPGTVSYVELRRVSKLSERNRDSRERCSEQTEAVISCLALAHSKRGKNDEKSIGNWPVNHLDQKMLRSLRQNRRSKRLDYRKAITDPVRWVRRRMRTRREGLSDCRPELNLASPLRHERRHGGSIGSEGSESQIGMKRGKEHGDRSLTVTYSVGC